MKRIVESDVPEEHILTRLKRLDHWLVWPKEPIPTEELKDPRADKAYKGPVQVDDETEQVYPVRWKEFDNWMSYNEAQDLLERYDGLLGGAGVYIDDSLDDFIIVDVDDCRDPETGRVDSQVWKHIRNANTYTEISQSGGGIHFVFRGKIKKQGMAEIIGEEHDDIGMEVYDRYFVCLTERHIAGTPFIAENNTPYLKKLFSDFDITWDKLFFTQPKY